MKRMMMLGLVSLSAFAGAVGAQDAVNHEFSEFTRWNDGSPYSGRCVVRVRTTSQHQLDGVLRIANDVWSERIGQGTLEIDIRRDRLDELVAIGVPYDVLIEDLQAHANTHAADMLRARRAERDVGLVTFQRGGQVHDDAWFATYRTLDEITRYSENIRAIRPDLATMQTIGQGIEGWLIFSLTISGPDTTENPRDDRPVVYIFSTVHAREWIAPMTTCYIASKLVADYDTDPVVRSLLDNTRIVIVPVGNPDGYLYSWSDERYWRKNRRDNGDGTYGVDINRNWGYRWGWQGSSSHPDSNTYRGTGPFSEPETRALRDAALSYGDKLIAHIDYHNYSQAVIWPFAYSRDSYLPEPAGSIFESLAEDIVSEIEHVHGANYDAVAGPDFSTAAGNSKDWFYGDRGVPSFTIEVRPRNSDFNPPVSEILPNSQENYAGFIRYLRRVSSPYNVWGFIFEPDPYVTNDPYAWLQARVSSDLEYAHPETVQVRSRVGSDGPYNADPMTRYPGSEWYTGEMPAYPCGSVIEYYYEAGGDLGRSGTYPFDGAHNPFSTTLLELVPSVMYDMEAEDGWSVGHPDDTATSGIWELADPEATPHQPGDDHTLDGNLCWVTDGRSGVSADAHDVDGGSTSLISPRFAASSGDGVSYWFSFSSSVSEFDSGIWLYASNDDGVTWELIGAGYPAGANWFYSRSQFEPFIQPTDQMRLRFVAFDSTGDGIVEAAIDDVQIDRIGCPPSPADLNGDGELNFHDVSAFIIAYNAGDLLADFDGNGTLNFFDVGAFLDLFIQG
ncbi:MAG: M14 family zinc carboxypeptidase [Phycisphaerales bacterium]